MNPNTVADVERTIEKMEPGHEFTTEEVLARVSNKFATVRSVAWILTHNPNVSNTTPGKNYTVWRRI